MNTYNYTWEEVYEKLPVRKEDSHKGTYGKLLLIAGGKNMAGAAFFAAKAAYRGGAGLVYIYTCEENRIILQQLIPEAVLYTYDDRGPDADQIAEIMKGKDAAAMGPGLGMDEAMVPVLKQVLAFQGKTVLDADGLNLLSCHMDFLKEKKCQLIITPHMMEMSRLCGSTPDVIIKDQVGFATAFAKKYSTVVVLKDHHTIVTDGDEVYRNQTGNHGMSTGGSGDVLTGVIGSMLVQKLDCFEAAKVGVYMHGKAGDDAAKIRGARSLMASDIADYVFYGL